MHSTTQKKRWDRFVATLSQIPLFGHLFDCTWNDYWESLVEYFNSLLWSTMPFWLGATLLFYEQQSGTASFWDTFTGTFRNGELLVFTIGTVTPITFMTLFEHPKGRFPHRLALGTMAIFLIVLCASFFALQKGKVPTKDGYVYYTSLAFTAVAISLRYIAIVYNRTKYPQTTEQDLIEPTAEYFEEFENATSETVKAQSSAPAQTSFDEQLAQATSAASPVGR